MVEEMGQQIRPLVYLIIKPIFSVVMSSAAMIRSPSFSREMESRTIMKWPCSVMAVNHYSNLEKSS